MVLVLELEIPVYSTVQESSTLNMMMGPHNRRSTQGNAFFAACAWLLARDGVKQQCSNLHSGLYWMGAMHPATPVHGHARYISRMVKYKKKVLDVKYLESEETEGTYS